MTFSDRTRMAALGLGATLAAFLVFRGGGPRPATPEDAVPRGSFLVASVDFAELRGSPVTEALLGGERSRALGIGPLREACGFDPLARVERATVSVPEETTERGEFGVAARVQVTADELRRCATRLAELRGAKSETREVGRFVVLESALATTDETGKDAKGPPPRLAYGAGGILLVGKGAWLDAMIAAADRRAPSLASSTEHGTLRASLTRDDGSRPPTVLVTALLPRALRDRLRTEMAAEAGADDPSGVVMGRVLGVSAVGVAIRTGPSSDRVDALAELVCDDEPACAAVERLLERKRREWSRDITLRLVGLGGIADTLQVEHTGTRVRVRAHASASALAGMVDRLGRPRRGPGAPPSPGAPGDARPAAPAPGGPERSPETSLDLLPDLVLGSPLAGRTKSRRNRGGLATIPASWRALPPSSPRLLKEAEMAGKNVIELTDANFDAEVLKSNVPVLVDFTATWCGPCKVLAPIVDGLADEFAGKYKIGKLDIDDAPGVTQRYGVRGVPTVMVFKGGEKKAQHVGVTNKDTLVKMLEG